MGLLFKLMQTSFPFLLARVRNCPSREYLSVGATRIQFLLSLRLLRLCWVLKTVRTRNCFLPIVHLKELFSFCCTRGFSIHFLSKSSSSLLHHRSGRSRAKSFNICTYIWKWREIDLSCRNYCMVKKRGFQSISCYSQRESYNGKRDDTMMLRYRGCSWALYDCVNPWALKMIFNK